MAKCSCCQGKDETQTKAQMTIALCGNPNCGKTTLFNVLTGSNQKVGNWPGVTVEKKSGKYKNDTNVAILDLPGIYSLSPFTIDEQVAHKYLLEQKPDLIINIVDSTNLERNLFLTSQLAELDVPVVVALNLQDEAEQKGIYINKDELEQAFGFKFFQISAAKNIGINELMNYCINKKPSNGKQIVYSQDIEENVKQVENIIDGDIFNKRWVTLKLLEKDKTVMALCNLTDEQKQQIEDINAKTKKQVKDIVSAEIVSERYAFIETVVAKAQKVSTADEKYLKVQHNTEAIDKIVLNKWLAFPIFVVVMALVFFIAMGSYTGGFLTDLISGEENSLTSWLTEITQTWLDGALGEGHWLTSLVVDGIIGGVMAVVGFVPQIMLLFGCIAILEASGYMSRIAFIMDRMLNKIGLGGKSFVSMIIGCGCSVPAIMATRTIKNINERNSTITLTPFMPCSAKLAIISFLSDAISQGDHGKATWIAISFYFLSILVVILGGLIMKVFNRKKTDASDTFVMELPTYRMPTIGSVLKQMWERGKAFLIKAGTIIFLATVILWLLQSFNFRFEYLDGEIDKSMLASIGSFIAPLFIPLGFGKWQFAVATLSGFAAKETVVATLNEVMGSESLLSVLGSGIAGYSFVVYNLLTVPCVSAVSASFTEQGNWKNGLKSMAFQLVLSYLVSLIIYQVGMLANKEPQAFIIGVALSAIVIVGFICVKYLVQNKGCNYECDHCPHNADCTKTDRK